MIVPCTLLTIGFAIAIIIPISLTFPGQAESKFGYMFALSPTYSRTEINNTDTRYIGLIPAMGSLPRLDFRMRLSFETSRLTLNTTPAMFSDTFVDDMETMYLFYRVAIVGPWYVDSELDVSVLGLGYDSPLWEHWTTATYAFHTNGAHSTIAFGFEPDNFAYESGYTPAHSHPCGNVTYCSLTDVTINNYSNLTAFLIPDGLVLAVSPSVYEELVTPLLNQEIDIDLVLEGEHYKISGEAFLYRDEGTGLQYTLIQPNPSLENHQVQIGMALFGIAMTRNYHTDRFWYGPKNDPVPISPYNALFVSVVILIGLILRFGDSRTWYEFADRIESTMERLTVAVEVLWSVAGVILYLVNLLVYDMSRKLLDFQRWSVVSSIAFSWFIFGIIVLDLLIDAACLVDAYTTRNRNARLSLTIRNMSWLTIILFALWPTFLEGAIQNILFTFGSFIIACWLICDHTSSLELLFGFTKNAAILVFAVFHYLVVQAIVLLCMILPVFYMWLGGMGTTFCVLVSICLDLALMNIAYIFTDRRVYDPTLLGHSFKF